MPKLEIINLHVSIDGKEILKGINLTINDNENVALLGQNGNGKSTLLHAIMGNPLYVITEGKILFNGIDITHLEVDERSKMGIFFGMQYPSEVPGVNNVDFLKASINARSEKHVSLIKLYKILDNAYKEIKMPFDLSTRNLNEGFSGGEKKKNEILQMMLLEPSLVMLDEIDSGLDVDAIQVISEIIKKEQENKSFLIISHYARLYNLIKVDRVVIIANGVVVLQGDKSLIQKVDTEGYAFLEKEHHIVIEREKSMNNISIGVCATKQILKNDEK